MSDSRDKMIQSAAALIGQRGLSATSLADVLGDSGAPRGSIYHHFPGGKRELAECAMRLTAEQVAAHVRASTARTPEEVITHFVSLFRTVVESSQGGAGCAVAGVTLDVEDAGDELLGVAREVFASWESLLADQLAGAGLGVDRARELATMCVASVEGGLILCRSAASAHPLDVIEAHLVALAR